MKDTKLKKHKKIIYSALGIIALIIAIVDSIVKNYFDSALSFAWSAVFISLAVRGWLDSKIGTKYVLIIHYILLVFIIVTSFAKLSFRLKIL